MDSKVWSDSEASTSQGASSSIGTEDSHFAVPSCSMCSRAEKSVSYCNSCLFYLCPQCTYAHKVMSFFRSHCLIDISCAENVEALEKIVQSEESASDDSSTGDSNSALHRKLEHTYWTGTLDINHLLTKSYDLNVRLLKMKKLRSDSINYISNVHNAIRRQLSTQVYQIIADFDAQFNNLYQRMTKEQEELEGLISEQLITEFDIRQYIDMNCANSSKLSFTSSQEIKSTLPKWHAMQIHNANHYDWKSFSNSASDNDTVSGEEQSINGSAPGSSKKDVVPSDLFNIPVVAYEPRTTKLMCSTRVNPNLSLTITDPGCLPNANPVNTMQIHKTFGQKGNGSGCFNSPHGFCLGFNEDIVVADTGNHRIQIFDKFGSLKSQFGAAGRQEGHLWYPRKIALLPSQRHYVVCDRGYERSRMQIFTEHGQFIKKIYIHYIDIVAGIGVTPKEDIVVVNSVTPTVFVMGQNDFLRTIDCSRFMVEPSDLTVLGDEIYICDFKAHSVVVIDVDGNFLRKFGDKNSTMFPNGIDVSLGGYVVVNDSHGNYFHLVVFLTDGTLVAEYRCPYIKVSRCCCLKITQEKRLVTVDKNYHHAIMLEAPFLKNC